MNKFLAISVSLITLSACVETAKITTPAINVTKAPNFVSKGLAEVEPTQIRTASLKEGTARKEIIGAKCNLVGNGFTAEFTTPAKVNVPSYRAASKPLKITCEHEGKTVTTTATAYNETRQERSNQSSAQGAQFGLVGMLVMGIADGATNVDQPNDTWGYGNIWVDYKVE